MRRVMEHWRKDSTICEEPEGGFIEVEAAAQQTADLQPRLAGVLLAASLIMMWLTLGDRSAPAALFHRLFLTPQQAVRTLKEPVALLHLIHWHQETVAALAYAWVRAGYEVEVFALPEHSFGIEEVMAPWFGGKPWRQGPVTAAQSMSEEWPDQSVYAHFIESLCAEGYGAFVFPTFSTPHLPLIEAALESSCGAAARLVLMMHRPQEELHPHALEVLRSCRVCSMLALAPHVATATAEALVAHNVSMPVQLFAQVFPAVAGQSQWPRHGFVVQGNLDQTRRNYSRLFAEVAAAPQLLAHKHFHLHLIGKQTDNWDSRSIPPQLNTSVHVSQNLPFPKFYAAVQASLGLVPAFATDAYYQSVFSASISTSLVTGSFLVADERLLSSYTFLTRDVVWFKRPGESDADVMARVLQTADDSSVLARKQDVLGALVEQLHARNAEVLFGRT